MFKRWPIRTKLFIAMGLLSTVVLLLASSGFWGLYHYRYLANSISQRAEEIPLANELNRIALTLRESHLRTREIGTHDEGMLESSGLTPLVDIAKLEADRFDSSLISFDLALERYESQIDESSIHRSLLIDSAKQQQSLQKIRQSYESLVSSHQSPSGAITLLNRSRVADRLDDLVEQTDQHLVILHGGMADFSQAVKGQYRTWITIAWSSTICAFSIVAMLLVAFRSLVVKPFRTLLGGSRLVAGGEFRHVIDLGTGDELSELAFAMNDMTRRFRDALDESESLRQDLDNQVRERTREVIQNERFASVGFLAAGVAHEINNPLATIAWGVESLQSRVTELAEVIPPDRHDDSTRELVNELVTNLQRVEDEAYRCKGITERLLDFSRLSEVRRAPTDLVELVNDVVAMVRTVGKFRCKSIEVIAPDRAIAHINSQEIRQVILNLLTNALESVESEGQVIVEVQTDGTTAQVIVQDNGCGMSAEVIKHLFEPFFTRRRDGTGTGLGLSITYRIVSQHGGSLVPFSKGEGYGSRMEMTLPVHPESSDSTATRPKPVHTGQLSAAA